MDSASSVADGVGASGRSLRRVSSHESYRQCVLVPAVFFSLYPFKAKLTGLYFVSAYMLEEHLQRDLAVRRRGIESHLRRSDLYPRHPVQELLQRFSLIVLLLLTTFLLCCDAQMHLCPSA